MLEHTTPWFVQNKLAQGLVIVNPTRLLRDPAVDTVFAMRVIRLRVLIRSHGEAIAVAEEISAGLEQILEN